MEGSQLPVGWLPKLETPEIKYELVLFSGESDAQAIPIIGLGSGKNDPGRFLYWAKMAREQKETLALGKTRAPEVGLSDDRTRIESVEISSAFQKNGFSGIIASALRGNDLSPLYPDAYIEQLRVPIPEKRKSKGLRTDLIGRIEEFNEFFLEQTSSNLTQQEYEPGVTVWEKAQGGFLDKVQILPIFDAAYLSWLKKGGVEHDPKVEGKAGTSKSLRNRLIANFMLLSNYNDILSDPDPRGEYATNFISGFLTKLRSSSREQITSQGDQLIDEFSGWGFIPEFLSDSIFQILDFYEPGKTAIDARKEVAHEWIDSLKKEGASDLFLRAGKMIESRGRGHAISKIDSFNIMDFFDHKHELINDIDRTMVYPELLGSMPFHVLSNPTFEGGDYQEWLHRTVNSILWEHDLGGRMYYSLNQFSMPAYQNQLIKKFLEGFQYAGLGRRGLSFTYKIAPELVESLSKQSFQQNHRAQFDELLGRIKAHKPDEGLSDSISKGILADRNLETATVDTVYSVFTDFLSASNGPLKQVANQIDGVARKARGSYLLVKALTSFGNHKWEVLDCSDSPLSQQDLLFNPLLTQKAAILYRVGEKIYNPNIESDLEELEQTYLKMIDEKEIVPLSHQIYQFNTRVEGQVKKLNKVIEKLKEGTGPLGDLNSIQTELSFSITGGKYEAVDIIDSVYSPVRDYITSILSLPAHEESDDAWQKRVDNYVKSIPEKWQAIVDTIGDASKNGDKKEIAAVGNLIDSFDKKSVKQVRALLRPRIEKYSSASSEVYQKIGVFLKGWDDAYEPVKSIDGLKDKLNDWEQKYHELLYGTYAGFEQLKSRLNMYRESMLRDFRGALLEGTDLGAFGLPGGSSTKAAVYQLGDMQFSADQITDPAIIGDLLRQPNFFRAAVDGKLSRAVAEVWGGGDEKRTVGGAIWGVVKGYRASGDKTDEGIKGFQASVSSILSENKWLDPYPERNKAFLKWMDESVPQVLEFVNGTSDRVRAEKIANFKREANNTYIEIFGGLKEFVEDYDIIYPDHFKKCITRLVDSRQDPGYSTEKAQELSRFISGKVNDMMKKSPDKWKKIQGDMSDRFSKMHDEVKRGLNSEVAAFFKNGGSSVMSAQYPGILQYNPLPSAPVPEWFKSEIQGWFTLECDHDLGASMKSAVKVDMYKERDIAKHVLDQFEKVRAAYLKPGHPYNLDQSGLLVDEVEGQMHSDLLDPKFIRIDPTDKGCKVYCAVSGGEEYGNIASYFSTMAKSKVAAFLDSAMDTVGVAVRLVNPDAHQSYNKTRDTVLKGL